MFILTSRQLLIRIKREGMVNSFLEAARNTMVPLTVPKHCPPFGDGILATPSPAQGGGCPKRGLLCAQRSKCQRYKFNPTKHGQTLLLQGDLPFSISASGFWSPRELSFVRWKTKHNALSGLHIMQNKTRSTYVTLSKHTLLFLLE